MKPSGLVRAKKARSASPSRGPAHPKIVGDRVMRRRVSLTWVPTISWFYHEAALAALAQLAAEIVRGRAIGQGTGLHAIEDPVSAEIDLHDAQAQTVQQVRIFLLE